MHYCLHPRIPWSTQVDIVSDVIPQKLSPVTFNVELNSGRTMKCHLRTRKDTTEAISIPITTLSDSVDIYTNSPSEDTTVSQTTTG